MSEFDPNSINNTLIEIFKGILKIIEGKTIKLTKIEFKLKNKKLNFCIDYDLLENDEKFYEMISILYNEILSTLDYYPNIRQISDNKLLPKKLFPIYINYLIRILSNNKDAYKNYIFKINILIFLKYLKNCSEDKLILSEDYFFLNINELEAIYHDEYILNEMTEIIKNEYYNIKFYMLVYLASSPIPELYQNDSKILGMSQELESDCDNNKIHINNFYDYLKKYDEYIQIQLDYIGKTIGIQNDIQCKNFEIKFCTNGIKKVNFKKYLFELEDLKEVIALIINFGKMPNPREALIYFNDNNFKLVNDLKEVISEIILSKEFNNKLKDVLSSELVKQYFNYPIKFKIEYETENYSVEESDLRDAYKEFMQNFTKEQIWLKNLIIFKDMPKGKRAFVNEIPKIFLNTLFINVINEPSKNNYSSEHIEDFKKIMSAYLIIILIYEIIHLLKFIKEKLDKKVYTSILSLPSTSKSHDFINYLFKVEMINEINIDQAEKILDINNWKKAENFHKIFRKKQNESNKDSKILSIKYCITDEKKKK